MAGSGKRSLIGVTWLCLSGAGLFLAGFSHASDSPEERGSEADFCSPGKKPLELELVIAVPVVPPAGTPVDKVADVIAVINKDIERLKRTAAAAFLTPHTYSGKMGTYRTRDVDYLTAENYETQKVSGAFCGSECDAHAMIHDENFDNNFSYSILSDKPPYKLIFCPYEETCLGKEEPLTKRKLSTSDLKSARDEITHAGYSSEKVRPQLLRISMELITEAGLKPPGDYLQTSYFSAPPSELNKMYSALETNPASKQHDTNDILSRLSMGQKSAVVLRSVIQGGTKISEKTEGVWKIVSIKFDPAPLCKYRRPISELFTK